MLRKTLVSLRRIADRDRIARRLRALDDHQLHDLGVSRDQIGAYVRAATRAATPSGGLRARCGGGD